MGCSWLPTGMKDHRDWKIVKGIGSGSACLSCTSTHSVIRAASSYRGVAARTCGRCRSNSGTPIFRRRRSTPDSRSTTYRRLSARLTRKETGGGLRVPPPRAPKLWGENNHQVNLAAPTGFEPVFQSRPRFRQLDSSFATPSQSTNLTRLKHAAEDPPKRAVAGSNRRCGRPRLSGAGPGPADRLRQPKAHQLRDHHRHIELPRHPS
jgi:hypothetical protein